MADFLDHFVFENKQCKQKQPMRKAEVSETI